LVGDSAKEVDISAIAGGERIESLRTLCQRFFMFEKWPTWSGYNPSTVLAENVYNCDLLIERVFFPPADYTASPFMGTACGKKHAYMGGGTVQQPTSFSYLNVFAQCFMGWRGSTRHKLVTRANYERFQIATAFSATAVVPDPPAVTQIRFRNAGYTTGTCSWTVAPQLNNTDKPDYSSGTLIFDPNQGQGGEFTFPYYAPRSYNVTRFTEVVPVTGSAITQRQDNPVEDNCLQIERYYQRTPVGVAAPGSSGINDTCGWDEHWMAAGKDFSLVRFRFIPVVRIA